MLNSIIFTAQGFKETEKDIVGALNVIEVAVKYLRDSELYKEEKKKRETE